MHMNAMPDLNAVDGVLGMTPARLKELRMELERASEAVISAMRRGGSPQWYSELCLLKTAVDTAQQVLASCDAHRC
jgi:hypothetical protein